MNNQFPRQTGRKVIYESDWICLYADQVEMPDGRILNTYHKLHYPHESVCVVIINDSEEILMIQSKRYVTARHRRPFSQGEKQADRYFRGRAVPVQKIFPKK